IAVRLQAPRQVVRCGLQVAGGEEGTRAALHVQVSVPQGDRGTQRRALGVQQLHDARGILGKARGQQWNAIVKGSYAGAKDGLPVAARRIEKTQPRPQSRSRPESFTGESQPHVERPLAIESPVVLRERREL